MHTCLRTHASYSPRIATNITTDTDAAAMYSRSGVDTCGVAGGHTQMINLLSAKSSLLAIVCRNERTKSVLGSILEVAPSLPFHNTRKSSRT